MRTKDTPINPNDEIIKGYIKSAKQAKRVEESLFCKDEYRIKRSSEYISSWLDSELSRGRERESEEKIMTSAVKARKISFEEESFEKINNQQPTPMSFVQECAKSNSSGTGSLPPKKRTFVDLTKNDSDKEIDSSKTRGY